MKPTPLYIVLLTAFVLFVSLPCFKSKHSEVFVPRYDVVSAAVYCDHGNQDFRKLYGYILAYIFTGEVCSRVDSDSCQSLKKIKMPVFDVASSGYADSVAAVQGRMAWSGSGGYPVFSISILHTVIGLRHIII